MVAHIKGVADPTSHYGQLFTQEVEVEIYTTSDLPFVGKIVNLDHGRIVLEELMNTEGKTRFTSIRQADITAYRWHEMIPPEKESP